MLLRPFRHVATSCASYLFGCGMHAKLAVVDPHAELVDDYLAAAAALGAPIVAVLETHVQADHVSGLPALVERSGATAYLPAGAGVEFEHVALPDGDTVELGNTLVTAIATPGHAPAHHAYTVADRRRGTDEPWLVFSGDSLLIGDVGRPDLHVDDNARGQARQLHASLSRLLELPDGVVLYPSHYAGSVCGRGLSGNPISTVGFERAHNPMLALADADEFVDALLADRVGRKRLLVAGWLIALPVPLLIGLAPSWWFIVAANLLLGINQGLAWSMTVVIDRPRRTEPARACARPQRIRRLPRRRRHRLRHRRPRRQLLTPHRRLDRRRPDRSGRPAGQRLRGPRYGRPGCTRAAGARRAPVRACKPQGGLRTGEPARPDPPRLQPGRSGQQPQRRARLGPGAALPRGPRRQRAPDRARRRRLPGRLGRRPTRDRLALRPHRPQTADRRRHARPGCRARSARHRPRRLHALTRRRTPARRRHRDGLPNLDRGCL